MAKEQPVKLSYKKRIKPVEYEITGVHLSDLVTPSFYQKMTENLGKLDLVSLAFVARESDDVIILWHKGPEDAEKGIITVNIKDEKVKEGLAKALGIEEE